MNVRKAIIPAGGRGTRLYPASTSVPKQMFPLVDRDGIVKPVIQIIVEEILESGIEQIGIVIRPGDEERYRRHFSGISTDLLFTLTDQEGMVRETEKMRQLEQAITYIVQEVPLGMGHAVHCARDWIDNEPFLLLTGDQINVSYTPDPCAKQLLDAYSRFPQTLFPLKRTTEDQLYLFGTVAAKQISGIPELYRILGCKDKPNLAYARNHFRISCLAEGLYLCFFGMYVFTPILFECLEYHMQHGLRESGEFNLTPALDMLCHLETVYGLELKGQPYDMGRPSGLVETQMALSLFGVNRTSVLEVINKISDSKQGG